MSKSDESKPSGPSSFSVINDDSWKLKNVPSICIIIKMSNICTESVPELVSSFARNRQSYAGMYPGRVLASSDAKTVILDAQNSSKHVNLDAQIMILDTQNQSIGVQLDLKDFVSNLANEIQVSVSK